MSNSPETGKSCQHCGKPIGVSVGQLCPECLMKMALGTGNDQQAPPKSNKPPVPTEIAVHFPQLEIIELLGKGGMGIVYKARQPKLNRFVALKLLWQETGNSRNFADRFQREAQALAHLNHPNIVTVYDFGEAGGFYYLLMEFVDGMNLRELLRSRKITPAEALDIVPPICDALQFAHKKGIVHRDIKPENILVDRQGRVKIADFGIAKILGAEQQSAPLTGERQSIGTPHYMAPEQVERPSEVDHRADIYSLGVVFYEMLTGELPLGRFDSPSQKVQIDVRLDNIVLRALEKKPERRYQQAEEVKTRVQILTASTQAPSDPKRPATRNPARWIAASALAIIAATSAFWWSNLESGKLFEPPKQRPVLLIDNQQATFVGDWTIGQAVTDNYGETYAHSPAESSLPQASATFRPFVTQPGQYDVEIFYPQGTNRSKHTWWVISGTDGESRVLVDQTTNGGRWVKIAGPVSFAAGTNGFVRVVNKTPGFSDPARDKVVVADAIRLSQPDAAKKSVAVENYTPEYIVAATLEKYKSLSSLRADSERIEELRYSDTPNVYMSTDSCAFRMARPYYLVYTSNEKGKPTNTIKEALWSNDDGAFETGYFSVERLKNRKETQIESIQYALDRKHPSPMVSEIFFNIHYNWLSQMTALNREPDALVDDNECYVVSSGTNRSPMVWIRKGDLMIIQKHEDFPLRVVSPPPATPSRFTAVPPPMPIEAMRSIPTRNLRLNPALPLSEPGRISASPLAPPSQAVSPTETNAIANLPPTPVPSSPTVTVSTKTVSRRTTQKLRHIVINEPIEKKSFDHASVPLLSDRNDPKARRTLAQAYMISGKNEQAVEEFMWCWDHGNEFKDYHGTRISFLLSDMGNFGMKYPPMLDAMRKRRDAIENQIIGSNGREGDVEDLSRLNDTLKDHGKTLALFDRFPKNFPIRKALFDHVFGDLLAVKRYNDIVPLLNPQKVLDESIQQAKKDLESRNRYSTGVDFSGVYAHMRKRAIEYWGHYFEVMAGTRNTAESKEMVDKILAFDSGEDLRGLLEKAAQHAGNQELVEYLQTKAKVEAQKVP